MLAAYAWLHDLILYVLIFVTESWINTYLMLTMVVFVYG